MGMVRYNEEQIIAKLRKAELMFAEGKNKSEVCKAIEVTPITLSRWQKKYGNMTKTEAKKLKELEKDRRPRFCYKGSDQRKESPNPASKTTKIQISKSALLFL